MSEIKIIKKIEINDPTPLESLQTAGLAYNFNLEPNRARRLIELAKYAASLGDRTENIFEENGLQIKRPVRMGVSGVPLSHTSRLDFLPIVDKDSNIVANPTPQRGSTTQITLMGIEAFQDFVLMANSGLIEKPESFFGITNPTMARFAKRVGFEETPRFPGGVTARYEDVAEKLFSPEILEAQQRLEERQVTLAAGALAVKN